MSSTTDNSKRIAREFYENYNRKNLQATFDTYVATSLVNHSLGGAYDRQAWLDFDSTLFDAFEDFTLEVLDQVAEGDKVATRFRLGGTHTGVFAGIAPQGNLAYNYATSVDRIEDGKIVEHWADMDFSGFLGQLSATN